MISHMLLLKNNIQRELIVIVFMTMPYVGYTQNMEQLYGNLEYIDGVAKKTICVKPLDLQRAYIVDENCKNVCQSVSKLVFSYEDAFFYLNIDTACENRLIDSIFLFIDKQQHCLITIMFHESCLCQFVNGHHYPLGIITNFLSIKQDMYWDEKNKPNKPSRKE